MSDEHFYAAALNELESNQANKDLLAKALVKASGDQTRQKSEYIKLRASQLSIAAKTSENSAMAKAMDFYNAKRYSDSVHGLTLLMKRKGDARAMVCLGNIYLHGVEGHPSDTRLAMELLASAERSKNADVRRFLGEILEPLGDWKRTLVNYDFAAKAGNERAKHLAAALRSRLEETGVTASNDSLHVAQPPSEKQLFERAPSPKQRREPSTLGWVGLLIMTVIIFRALGVAGGLVTFGLYSWLQPRIGTFLALVVSAVIGAAVGVAFTLAISGA